jgi:hypothetical protein
MVTLVRKQMFPTSRNRFGDKVENIALRYMTYVSRHAHRRRRNEVTRLTKFSISKEFYCVHYETAVELQQEVK